MQIITGYTGTKHITSEQDRDVNIGLVGPDSYVLTVGTKLEAEVSSNNEIKIHDGVVMHQGCAGTIKKNTYDSVTITNGSQGVKRIDLLVLRYEKNQDTNIESLTWKVLQGTPSETDPAVPEYIEGDIQAGDSVADMPLYEIELDGINVVEVRPVFQVRPENKWTEFLPVRNPSSKITIDSSRPWGFYYNPGLKMLIMNGGFVTKQSITTDDILGYLPEGIPFPDSGRFMNVGFMGYTTSGGVEFASPRALAIGQSAGAILFRSAAQAGVTYISEFTYVWDY